MDWDTLQRVFTAVAVPIALGVGWLLKRHDAARTAAHLATENAAEIKVEADRVVIEQKTTDARLHEIALQAAEEASSTWKEVVEYMRNVELPALRRAIEACEERDAARAIRITHLEAALGAAGIPLP